MLSRRRSVKDKRTFGEHGVNRDNNETKAILFFDGLQETLEPGVVVNCEGLIEGRGEILGSVSGIHQPFPG